MSIISGQVKQLDLCLPLVIRLEVRANDSRAREGNNRNGY